MFGHFWPFMGHLWPFWLNLAIWLILEDSTHSVRHLFNIRHVFKSFFSIMFVLKFFENEEIPLGLIKDRFKSCKHAHTLVPNGT